MDRKLTQELEDMKDSRTPHPHFQAKMGQKRHVEGGVLRFCTHNQNSNQTCQAGCSLYPPYITYRCPLDHSEPQTPFLALCASKNFECLFHELAFGKF